MTDRMNRTALHYAALEGDSAQVRELIAAGADPNAVDANDWTPLHLAAQQAHLDAVRSLVDAGAEIEARNEFGNTPLWVSIFATGDDSIPVTRELLARGADPDVRNNTGKSPRDIVEMIVNQELKTIFAEHP